MQRVLLGIWLLLAGFSLSVQADEISVYPGAVLDEAAMQKYQAQMAHASRDMKRMMGDQQVYTTPDSFAIVYEYYKNLYPETDLKIKKIDKKMPNGKRLNDAYFCADQAKNSSKSKQWIKLQSPYVGHAKIGKRHRVTYEDVRDVTVITIVQKQ